MLKRNSIILKSITRHSQGFSKTRGQRNFLENKGHICHKFQGIMVTKALGINGIHLLRGIEKKNSFGDAREQQSQGGPQYNRGYLLLLF